jgi:hypothetical protein
MERQIMEALAPKITNARQTAIAFLDPLSDFYERLLPLEVVEALYADWHPHGVEVWLVVYQASEADRQQIYREELGLMQAFPGLGLDTHLIDRTEVDPLTIVDLMAVDAFLRFPRLHHA